MILIILVIDVAQVALSRCVEREYDVQHNDICEVTKIHYLYEFLDDFITPQPTVAAFMADVFQWNHKETLENTIETPTLEDEKFSEDIQMQSIPTVQDPTNSIDERVKAKPMLECEDGQFWMQEKFNLQNHPLELMVSY